MRHLAILAGGECWEPTDQNDIGFLLCAEGATFRNTVFPSGWKSPDKDLVCRNGKLYNS